MKVIEKKPVSIYEVECHECKSKIQYKASEINWCHITCPVCGVSIWGTQISPVKMEVTMETKEAIRNIEPLLDPNYPARLEALRMAISALEKQERQKFQGPVVSIESVLKIIEDIKDDESIPKNYGTLVDIMTRIRQLSTT